jgi:nucleotide-binding universal stress UspA family protein
MYYKSILVHVSTSTHTLARCQIAARLAIQEDAHLVGTAATSLPIEFFLPGMVGETNAAIGLYLETMRTRAEGALAIFEAAAKQAGVGSIEPRIIEDEAASAIALHSRYSDLVIIGQVDPDEMLPDMRGDFPQYVVLNSARPVLIIPYAGQFDEIGTNILIAWDASLEATRAVTAALPLLKRAKQVQVAVFNPNQGSQDRGGTPDHGWADRDWRRDTLARRRHGRRHDRHGRLWTFPYPADPAGRCVGYDLQVDDDTGLYVPLMNR